MENNFRAKKADRTTPEQLKLFVEFSASNAAMTTGRNTPKSPSCIQQLWEELTLSLNSMRGPTKTASEWKKSLGHWKNMVRSRAREFAAQCNQTGGGPQTCSGLNELEERALAVFGKSAVFGHPSGSPLGFVSHSKRQIAGCTARPQPLPEVEESAGTSLNNEAPTSRKRRRADPDIDVLQLLNASIEDQSNPKECTIDVQDQSQQSEEIAGGSAVPQPLPEVENSARASPTNEAPTSRKRRRADPDIEALDLIKVSIESQRILNERAIAAQVETAAALREMASAILELSKAYQKQNN